MPCRLATIGIGSRSASRRIITICSSENLDLRMLPSESEGSLSSNAWSEITGADQRLYSNAVMNALPKPIPRCGALPAIAIGGGLAGAAFALELARNGRRVVVLERTR